MLTQILLLIIEDKVYKMQENKAIQLTRLW